MSRRSMLFLVIGLVVCLSTISIQAAKTKVLNIWVGYPELLPVIEGAIEDYEKNNPQINVNVVSFNVRELERKVAVSVPTGSAADIILLDHMPGMRYISNDLFQPVPAELDNMIKASFDQDVYELSVKDNKLYAVPWFIGIQTLYYNKTMFKEAGLTNPPETMDQLMDYARKLAKYDNNGNLIQSGLSLRLSGSGSGIAHKWAPYLIAFGGDILVKTPSGKYHNGYDNEAGRNALKFYIDLVHKYNADNLMVKHDSEAFALQNTAMFYREAWVIGYMKTHAPNVDYDTAPVPGQEKRGTTIISCNFYVPTTSKNSDEAWSFLSHLLKEKYAKTLMTDAGWIPSRIDLDYSSVYVQHPQFRGFTNLPEDFIYSPFASIEPADEIYTKLASRLANAFANKSLVDNPEGIAKAISRAANETDSILKKYNLYGLK